MSSSSQDGAHAAAGHSKAAEEYEDSKLSTIPQSADIDVSNANDSHERIPDPPEIKCEPCPSPPPETIACRGPSRSEPQTVGENLPHHHAADISQSVRSQPTTTEVSNKLLNACEDESSSDSKDVVMTDCMQELRSSSQERESQHFQEANLPDVQIWIDEKAGLLRNYEELQTELRETSISWSLETAALRKQIETLQQDQASAAAPWRNKEDAWNEGAKDYTLKRKRELEGWEKEKSQLISHIETQETHHKSALECILEAAKRDRRQRDEFEDQLEAMDNSQKETLKDLAKTKKRCHGLTAAWTQAVDELAQLKVDPQKFVVDDEVITTHWGQLDYAIRQLTSLHLGTSCHVGRLRRKHAQLFSSVSNDFGTYLQSKTRAPRFFQGVIWRVIFDRILSQPAFVWGEAAGQSVDAVSQSISNQLDLRGVNEQYHKWRAQTGLLMHHVGSSTEGARDLLAEEIGDLVLAYSTNKSITKVEDMITKISQKAVELAVVFSRSRAFYQVTFDTVQDTKLVLSPGLLKCGDSDGNHYEEEIELVAATALAM